MELQPETRPRHCDGVLARETGESVVLLNVDNGTFFELDGVGSRIWEMCGTGSTVDEIVTRICTEYEADRSMVEADVVELLRELGRERLIAYD